MAEFTTKKFLDQAGVSTLWSKIVEEVGKVDAKAIKNTEEIDKLGTRLGTAEGKIAALEAGTYDDTEVRGLIAGNAANITTNAGNIALNASAIAVLNGNAETTGSVANTATAIAAAEVAKIVADADASYDTLKEIADWILNDTTGAADMANDIAALELKVGNMAVVDQISTAINNALKIDGVEKYALASALTAAVDRVKALEDAGFQNAEQVGSAIDAKITALDLANTYDAKGAAAAAETAAKAHADGLNTAMNTRVATLEGIDHNKILTDAKAYTDTEINTKIIALTKAEIDQAIANAKAAVQA